MLSQERIKKMDAKLEEEKRLREEAKAKAKKEREEAMSRFPLYKERIIALLEVGEYCFEKKISFPNGEYRKYAHYRNDFESDGIRHLFGFIKTKNNLYIGWLNGGWNGSEDVMCDGDLLSYIDRERKTERPVDNSSDILKFFNEFEEFEKAFYAWFDKLAS